ncbi:Ig-like domain repeat protein, partial [Methanobrevibacter sp.]|uniref:Ig-like domain repeat protein n=1 Tax=Methanobrevibacter sp. TaxID=66852 RepID=UPI0026E04FC5
MSVVNASDSFTDDAALNSQDDSVELEIPVSNDGLDSQNDVIDDNGDLSDKNSDLLVSNGLKDNSVSSNPLNTVVSASDVSGKPGTVQRIDIAVVDENGNPVRDGSVTVVLPDGKSQNVYIFNGQANVYWTIPENFKAGNYAVNIAYTGNNNYHGSSTKSYVKVLALDTVVSAVDVSGKPGSAVVVEIAVVDENGNPVRDGSVTVMLPDDTIETAVVSNGKASVTWNVPADFKAGGYDVNLKYLGNDDYNPSEGKFNVMVLALDTVVSAVDVSGKPG